MKIKVINAITTDVIMDENKNLWKLCGGSFFDWEWCSSGYWIEDGILHTDDNIISTISMYNPIRALTVEEKASVLKYIISGNYNNRRKIDEEFTDNI